MSLVLLGECSEVSLADKTGIGVGLIRLLHLEHIFSVVRKRWTLIRFKEGQDVAEEGSLAWKGYIWQTSNYEVKRVERHDTSFLLCSNVNIYGFSYPCSILDSTVISEHQAWRIGNRQ